MVRTLLIFVGAILLLLLPAAPVFAAIIVATGPAVDVTATSAMLTGQLTSMDTHKSVLVWFEYGPGPGLGNTTTQQQHPNPGACTAFITGLHPGTTYHFRAVALVPMPGAQPVYGAVMTFATHTPTPSPPPPPPPPPPSALRVTTGAAHDVTGNSAYLNGELNATGGNSSVQVWFDWGTSTAYGTSTPRQTHTAPGSFSFPLAGLNPGTTYHFRAAAIPTGMVGAQPVYGANVSFTTASAPGLQVVTESASGVTATTATVAGNLVSLGSSNAIVNVWFEWGTTTAYGNRTTGQPQTKPTVFSATLANLTGNTTYHFRAVAHEEVSGGATVYGNDKVFATAPQPGLTVVTESASTITATTAYLNGDVTSLGPYKSVEVWFEWGTTTAYGTVTARQAYTGTGAFSSPITGLFSGTMYHFRAAAQAPIPGALPVYGADRSFIAAPTPDLTVVTEPASSVSANSAFLNGDLTSIGVYKAAEVWFEWGTTVVYDKVSPVQKQPSSGIFSAPVGGLSPGTTYHFRAVARGDALGAPVIYGYDRSFIATPTPSLVVMTAPATGVTFTSAYLNGDLISLGSFTPVEVWFEWGPDTGYGATTPRQSYTGPIDFSAPIAGLNPGTIYHFRAAVRPSMPGAQASYGSDLMFTTAQTMVLTVVTELATDIQGGSATLNGELDSLGNYSVVQVWFDWGATAAYGNSTAVMSYAAPIDFSTTIAGLTQGITYHYRVAASGAMPGAPPVYGGDISFTASPLPNPMVNTEPATEIATLSAVLNGELLSLNSFQSVPVYFEWGLSTAYGTTTPTHIRTGIGDFGAQITGLTQGTTYHYRAVAVPDGKPVYGNDVVFTTGVEPSPKPRLRVSATPAGGITATSAALNGRLDSLGNYTMVEVWFEWGKTTAYGTATARQALRGADAFSAHLTGLSPDVSYHFRAMAAAPGEAAVPSADEVFATPAASAPFDTIFLLGIIIGVLVIIIIVVLAVVLSRR